MGKNVGLTYGEFKFPAEQGFTGSAGVDQVKGYMRGGHVRSPDKTKGKGKSRAGMPANVKMKGGEVHAAAGGYYGKPGDKYPTLKSGPKGKQGSSMPKNVKKHGGKVSMHDKLKHEGGKMGYKYGGQVKPSNTSAEFKMTKGKQDTMDHGVQPAQTGITQAEVAAGGNKRLKAGYKHGGGVRKVRLHKSASRRAVGTTRSAHGGLAKYAHGGGARKPYTGYNKQAGGSGNEDARYMQAKK
jgi:hypothetical protein